jgi:hypothetical protein
MTDDPLTAVWELIAAEEVEGPAPEGTVSRLNRLCRAGVRGIPASGLGVSVLNDEGDHGVAAVSDAVSAEVEELQFSLGEGPCIDAHASGRPVLQSALDEAALRRWPGYARAAYEHGVRAVFAFPLQIGAARVGVLDVYRDSAGALSGDDLGRAFAFADAALTTLLDGQAEVPAGDIDDGLARALTHHRAEVYQAQGMVRVQLGVSLEDALALIRAHAFAHSRALSDVAADIVARRLTLRRGDT